MKRKLSSPALLVLAAVVIARLTAQPPNLEEGREALRNILKDAHRAGAVISRFRGLVKKAPRARMHWSSTARSWKVSR
jgi:hypothetical protein